MFADIRHFIALWNLSGPDCYAQNDLNQVVRYSVADGKLFPTSNFSEAICMKPSRLVSQDLPGTLQLQWVEPLTAIPTHGCRMESAKMLTKLGTIPPWSSLVRFVSLMVTMQNCSNDDCIQVYQQFGQSG